MIIEISNCKNIKNLKLTVEDKKINVVVGNSGAGKSTIVEALSTLDLAPLQSVYTKSNPQVTVDGKTTLPIFKIFDDNYRKNILIERGRSNDVYEIFVGDSIAFINYKENFDKALATIKAESAKIDMFKNAVLKVEKEIMKRSRGKTTPTPKSKIIVFEKNIESLSREENRIIKNFSSQHFSWIKQGEQYQRDFKKCPYCNRKMTESVLRKINIIKNLDEKEFSVLENATPLLNDLNIPEPNFFKKRDLSKLKKSLIEKMEIRDELDKLTGFIGTYENVTFSSQRNIPKVTIKRVVYDDFPELEQMIMDLNKSIMDLNKEYNKCISAFNKEIRKSSQKLNSFLNDFGIPYEFKVSEYYATEKTANYVLSHIADPDKMERTFGLSAGEKNIVALLLFLNRINDENIIIDDPASSFDEYKRKTMYEKIIKECKSKTVLLLSHDLVFGKFFAYDNSQINDKARKDALGKLVFLENYDYESEVIVKDVHYSDFLTINEHIINFLQENTVTYFEKIILLRILFEPNKRRTKINPLYGYLSAVLHGKSNEDIESGLLEKSLTEEEVVDNILSLVKDGYDLEDFTLEKHNVGIGDPTINNKFIKLMKLREDKTINYQIRKELSSIIHLNEAHVLQLNPLKFNYFSKKIYDLII